MRLTEINNNAESEYDFEINFNEQHTKIMHSRSLVTLQETDRGKYLASRLATCHEGLMDKAYKDVDSADLS